MRRARSAVRHGPGLVGHDRVHRAEESICSTWGSYRLTRMIMPNRRPDRGSARFHACSGTADQSPVSESLTPVRPSPPFSSEQGRARAGGSAARAARPGPSAGPRRRRISCLCWSSMLPAPAPDNILVIGMIGAAIRVRVRDL